MRGLRFFRAATSEAAPAGPPPAEMRGRASQISDPSPYRWEVIWEALKIQPPADQPGTLTQELGLDQEQEIAPGWSGMGGYATELSGTRHGRPVALRMGVFPRIHGGGYNEVQLKVPVPQFRLHEQDGRPTVESGGTPELAGMLAALASAAKVWRKLEVEGGLEGILARRPVTAHPQGYLYDLWLIERIAEQLGV
jgi:hypothetical protein